MKKIKKTFLKFIFFLMDLIRPFIGPPETCIYPVSCTEYTKSILKNKPLYVAIPLIIFRLLSCNPITSLYWRIKNYCKG
ncbi:membrane protein insertion efficiency factor YidD [Candidatus Dependentiae bacterium]|nr:membrane protein insertion efficiency factor YidD [Candidatus Dependentiae bacterium]